MALVSYDYSSGSDKDEITDEEDDESTTSKVILTGQNAPVAANGISEKQDIQSTNDTTTENSVSEPEEAGGLFSHLPQAKSNVSQILEENDQLEDFIPTVKTLKEKKKVQITIPSLSDFEEPSNEEPAKKRLKPSQIGSGLLGMLPPVQSAPKSNTMFVPNTLRKASVPVKPATTSKALIPQSAKSALDKKKKSSTSVKSKTESDSDTDNEDMPIPDTFDDQMWETVCGRTKPPKPTVKLDMTTPEEPVEEITSAPVANKPYDGLDNVAFKELVGKSKRPMGNIKVIDIKEDEILGDRDLWMTKSLTDPDLAPRSESQDSVDPTKKRKHHITYLAQQAKANEQELKSSWAAGRSNRMMSRSKYGF